ncbi:hypothetical protein [Duganella sp. Root336D2]|uniref:hypothetical protein n=1 Tax=Duganella sp. Root336D2 TaxID=1736518 RepID=UPI0006F88ACF|nr:hypothetical protein [Duganella sp. Root336D2]KQV58040.1 hypothetical protein ASD07_26735 [Duganella sp. Root336D2]
MNRLPPVLPGRCLDELLPGRPNVRTGQQPAWRFATTAAAQPAATAQAAPRPARAYGKPAAPARSEPPRTVRAAPNPVREQLAEDHGAWRTGQGGSGDGQGRSSDGGDSGGEGDAEPALSGAAPPGAEAFDAEDIVALLPAGDCSGIFEVQLPGGEMMGVAVDAGPCTVSYHLKPAGKNLADRLRSQQKELTARLERRIGKDVTLTIL